MGSDRKWGKATVQAYALAVRGRQNFWRSFEFLKVREEGQRKEGSCSLLSFAVRTSSEEKARACPLYLLLSGWRERE